MKWISIKMHMGCFVCVEVGEVLLLHMPSRACLGQVKYAPKGNEIFNLNMSQDSRSRSTLAFNH